jgi:8-oxo-dGTP pyrophosphatase MutT (NUDIX family)
MHTHEPEHRAQDTHHSQTRFVGSDSARQLCYGHLGGDEACHLIRERRAVRALLIAEAEILLIKARLPDGRHCWMTPGGGVEAGESDEQALVREVWEETTLELDQRYPMVWMRSHLYGIEPRQVMQHEHYFLVPTEKFEPSMDNNPARGELNVFRGFQWWSFSDIEASNELFAPNKLGRLLGELTSRPTPTKPLRIGR